MNLKPAGLRASTGTSPIETLAIMRGSYNVWSVNLLNRIQNPYLGGTKADRQFTTARLFAQPAFQPLQQAQPFAVGL